MLVSCDIHLWLASGAPPQPWSSVKRCPLLRVCSCTSSVFVLPCVCFLDPCRSQPPTMHLPVQVQPFHVNQRPRLSAHVCRRWPLRSGFRLQTALLFACCFRDTRGLTSCAAVCRGPAGVAGCEPARTGMRGTPYKSKPSDGKRQAVCQCPH